LADDELTTLVLPRRADGHEPPPDGDRERVSDGVDDENLLARQEGPRGDE
jgi:hypothetical protein